MNNCVKCNREFGENLKLAHKGMCWSCYNKDFEERSKINDVDGRRYTHCLKCGVEFNEKIKHHGKGLCRSCYSKNRTIELKDNKEYKLKNRRSSMNYYYKHLPKIRQYYKDNKEKKLEQQREYRKTPKGRQVMKRDKANRKAIYKDKKVPKNFILEKLIINDYTCGNIYCNEKIDLDNLWLEHLLPISKGGDNDPQNLDIWCPKCNNNKKAKTIEQFYLDEQIRLGFMVF